MDTERFDAIARLFAGRRTRRAALTGGGTALAAAALAPLGARVTAQEATPDAVIQTGEPADPHPSADDAAANPTFLFVQPFAGGTWAPKAGEEGVFTLTLSGAPATTAYFSDRPDRVFGLWPTQQFLDTLGFTPSNPPNAALVAQRPDGGEQEVFVVELLDPTYDKEAGALIYDAKVLADYGDDGLAHAARQQTGYELPESFAAGGLFIDSLDCPDGCAWCYRILNDVRHDVGLLDIGYCGSLVDACSPCSDDERAQRYGTQCAESWPNTCYADNRNGSFGWNCLVEFLEYPGYSSNLTGCDAIR